MPPKYTEMAVQAIGFAELFNITFKQPLVGPPTRKVELGVPDGPSTAGGKQAMQAIKLVPVGEGTMLVMGTCNPATKVAELRSYELMAEMNAKRTHGEALQLAPLEYRKLVLAMERFLKNEQFTVTVAKGSGAPLTVPAAPASKLPLVAAVVGLVLAALAAGFYLRRR